eukprot:125634-Pleurochrysis_carterae.AAC.4
MLRAFATVVTAFNSFAAPAVSSLQAYAKVVATAHVRCATNEMLTTSFLALAHLLHLKASALIVLVVEFCSTSSTQGVECTRRHSVH